MNLCSKMAAVYYNYNGQHKIIFLMRLILNPYTQNETEGTRIFCAVRHVKNIFIFIFTWPSFMAVDVATLTCVLFSLKNLYRDRRVNEEMRE
jgi:hypothetical protein